MKRIREWHGFWFFVSIIAIGINVALPSPLFDVQENDMHPKQYERYHATGYGKPLSELGKGGDPAHEGLLPNDLKFVENNEITRTAENIIKNVHLGYWIDQREYTTSGKILYRVSPDDLRALAQAYLDIEPALNCAKNGGLEGHIAHYCPACQLRTKIQQIRDAQEGSASV